MKEIIVLGETVEEAVDKGLRDLNLDRNQVEIVVLESGKKGFLTLGSRQAKVKLIPLNMPSESITTEKTTKTLMKVENGRIIIVESEPESFVEVLLPDEIEFSLNGKRMTDKILHLTSNDKWEVSGKEITSDTVWDIRINNTETEAMLYVEPGDKIVYELVDHPTADKLSLSVKENRSVHQTLTKDEIKQRLKQLNITYGIDLREAEKQLEASTEPFEVRIAKGIEPTEGKNGWLEFYVNINEDTKFIERADGTIDFKNKRVIPAVEEGTQLCYIHSPEEGIPGTSIFGDEIQPKSVQELKIRKGKGVTLSPDGKVILSTNHGRPSVEINGNVAKLEVIPKLEHNGDVSFETGNLIFNGDIEITGNVEDGMKVKATGDIEIRGMCSHATIVAGKSITLRGNVISSSITSGYRNKLLAEKTEMLERIGEKLQAIVLATNQLVSQQPTFLESIKHNGPIPVIRLLITQKFEAFSSDIKGLYEDIRKEPEMFDDHWVNTSQRLFDAFVAFNPLSLKTIQELENLVKEATELFQETNEGQGENNSITFSSAMNSEIYSTGDITLIRKGSYNSVIYAGGFLKTDGYIKGGKVFAGNGADIKEAGSKGGVSTLLITKRDKKLKIKTALSESILQIGRQRLQLTRDEKNVEAHLDESDRIVLR